jgi:hypothetical protein
MASALAFACPFCAQRYTDELEVLDAGECHDVRCETCGLQFLMYFAECLSCNEDVICTWNPGTSAILACHACGSTLLSES